MVQNTDSTTTGSSALEREAASGMNNPVQVEQDNRVAKVKADAKAAEGGPDHPEDGLNQDG